MRAVVVIPARFRSERFPGKVIAPIKGIPMVEHVYRGCMRARKISDIIIATDDERVYKVARSFGAKVVITSPEHNSGTERVAEVAANLKADVFVNVQADEPLIRAEMVDQVIELLEDKEADMGTLAKQTSRFEEIFNPNVVKVVTDKQDFAMYFSRAPIPFPRDNLSVRVAENSVEYSLKADHKVEALKHIGIYSYRKDALLKLVEARTLPIERSEKLEQLKALAIGLKIKVAITGWDTIGVDTPEDLIKVEKMNGGLVNEKH